MPSNSQDYMRNYYEKNKAKWKHKELVYCDYCKKHLSAGFWNRHLQTKGHIQRSEACPVIL